MDARFELKYPSAYPYPRNVCDPCYMPIVLLSQKVCSLDHHGDALMEAVRTSETSFNFNATLRRYIPEDSPPWQPEISQDFKLHLSVFRP
jgi:hypothetical protein